MRRMCSQVHIVIGTALIVRSTGNPYAADD